MSLSNKEAIPIVGDHWYIVADTGDGNWEMVSEAGTVNRPKPDLPRRVFRGWELKKMGIEEVLK